MITGHHPVAEAFAKYWSPWPPNQVITVLRDELSRDVAAEFYRQIRDRCPVNESEWRAEFLELFPQVAAADL